MEFCLLDIQGKQQYRQALFEILAANENAFVPPLSQRTNTTQMDLRPADGDTNLGNVCNYFEQMMKQNVLAIFHQGEMIGFVSFLNDFVTDLIGVETHPNIYISTVVVRPEARGMGATKKAYTHLFTERYSDCNVFTRTWSTNAAHIKILESFDFAEIKRILDDRGEGIDTVYYGKYRDNKEHLTL